MAGLDEVDRHDRDRGDVGDVGEAEGQDHAGEQRRAAEKAQQRAGRRRCGPGTGPPAQDRGEEGDRCDVDGEQGEGEAVLGPEDRDCQGAGGEAGAHPGTVDPRDPAPEAVGAGRVQPGLAHDEDKAGAEPEQEAGGEPDPEGFGAGERGQAERAADQADDDQPVASQIGREPSDQEGGSDDADPEAAGVQADQALRHGASFQHQRSEGIGQALRRGEGRDPEDDRGDRGPVRHEAVDGP